MKLPYFHAFYQPLKLLSLLLMVIACVAGCRTVGPDYSGTSGPVLPVSYQAPSNDGQLLPACQATCEPRLLLFSDPVLNALIARAEQQNFSLCEAYQRIVEARAWSQVTRGGRLPQADAIAEYGRTKRSANARPFVGSNNVPFDLFSLGIDSSWEIDLFGKIQRQIEVSQAELAMQQENFEDVRLTLLSDVATNYVRVRVLQQQLHIAQQNLKLQEETSELISQLEKSGKVTSLDVAQSKALRYATMSEVPILEQQLQLAFNQLSILLGEAPGPAMRACIGYGPIPAPPELAALGIPANLVRRRPDIRRAEQEVVAASARIGVAKADLYPQLTLLGAISVDSKNVSSLFTNDSLTFSAGPSFRWNILNFWRVTSSIKAYESQYCQAVSRYRGAVLKAVREVEDGLSNNHWEQFRKTALEQTSQADAKSVELSLARYKAGKASYQRVLDSQELLLRDQQKLATSRGVLALELIRISKAVGGGWCPGATSTSRASADQTLMPENLLFSKPKKSSKTTAKKDKTKKGDSQKASTRKTTPEKSPAKPKTKPTEKSPKASKPKEPVQRKVSAKAPAASVDEGNDAADGSSNSSKNNSSSNNNGSLWRLPSPQEGDAPLESQAQQADPKSRIRHHKNYLESLPRVRRDPFLVSFKRSSAPSAAERVEPKSASFPSKEALATQSLMAVSSASPWPLWKNLVVALLSFSTLGLSHLFLSILSQRRA